MKRRTSLGEFEELVLIIAASLDSNAYGVTITQEIERQTSRRVGFNTVHTTLRRLEEKGFISSKMGGATAERGGGGKGTFESPPLAAGRLWKLSNYVRNFGKGCHKRSWESWETKLDLYQHAKKLNPQSGLITPSKAGGS
jgi:hypothetical protein